MPSKHPKVRVTRETYDAIAELARRWNVSMRKVIDLAIQHASNCNRIGISQNYPPTQQSANDEAQGQPLWWQMCSDILWVCEAIIDALHRLADIYPDLKADWMHTPYEAARRFEIVARDWGLMQPQEQAGKTEETA